MNSAETMWLRSVDKHKLRYRTMLSDGDSKAHKKVDGNPYDVSKEECVNHVHNISPITCLKSLVLQRGILCLLVVENLDNSHLLL